ncbi:MAG: copper resistance protein CopC [Candidatus Rokuibacteriota bacterium]|nr:MAG: copper resistance protein CopC [Candidatus Rokubacteria bacterium]
MRLSGRLHHAADGEGQAGGLRGLRRPRARRLALISPWRWLLAAGLVLAVATPSAAHSLLLESVPPAGATLTTPPRELMLRFNNRIEKSLSRVRLLDERGSAQPLAVPVTGGTADRLTAVVPPLAPGRWRVEWQVLSMDGHVVAGRFEFLLAP